MLGDSISSALMQRALDGTWQRQRAIANNIANYETPGYKAIQVSFEEALNREVLKIKSPLSSTDEIADQINRLANSEITARKNWFTSERMDGNNVNLDVENINMAKTQIQYQYLTRGMTDMFARLKYAINEGKR